MEKSRECGGGSRDARKRLILILNVTYRHISSTFTFQWKNKGQKFYNHSTGDSTIISIGTTISYSTIAQIKTIALQ